MEPSKEYLNGFNHGYFLRKYEPELLEDILQSPQTDNQYFEGLKDGRAELDKEITLNKEHSPFPELMDGLEERLNNIPSKDDPQKEKGDDREPEQ